MSGRLKRQSNITEGKSPDQSIKSWEECVSHNEKGTENAEECMIWSGLICEAGKDDGSKECDRIRKGTGGGAGATGGFFLMVLVSPALAIRYSGIVNALSQ